MWRVEIRKCSFFFPRFLAYTQILGCPEPEMLPKVQPKINILDF